MGNISPKVTVTAGTGVTVGTAAAYLLVWSLNKYAHAGIDAEAATMIGAIVSPLIGAVAGYFAPHSAAA